jgi:hypothetical protein
MENNLYQIELKNKNEKEELRGYILVKQNAFVGILYTNDRYVYSFIYGKYISKDKVKICINGIHSGEYQFSSVLYARDGSPYETFIPINIKESLYNKLMLMHLDIEKGVEIGRVNDISVFVEKQFDKHIVEDKKFSESYNLYFGETEPFQKIRKLISQETFPF